MPKVLPLVSIVLLLGQPLAFAGFDGFEVSEGYSGSPNQTLIGLPNPGTNGIWNGPWQNVSDPGLVDNKDFQSSNFTGMSGGNIPPYEGSRTLEMKKGSTQPGRVEAVRPFDPGMNASSPFAKAQFDVYFFLPSKTKNLDSEIHWHIYTGQLGSVESAGFMMKYNSTTAKNYWWVWDGGNMVNTGVEAADGRWVGLSLVMDLTNQTYTAYVDGTQVAASQTLHFGNVNTSSNLTGMGFATIDQITASRDVFFDAASVTPLVPELPSWITLGGFLSAAVVPICVWRRRQTHIAGSADS